MTGVQTCALPISSMMNLISSSSMTFLAYKRKELIISLQYLAKEREQILNILEEIIVNNVGNKYEY